MRVPSERKDIGSAFSCCETRRKNDLPRPQKEKLKH